MYICKKLRIKTFLESRGFKCVSSMPDRNNPQYSVFMFDKTQALMDCVNEYYSQPYFKDKDAV